MHQFISYSTADCQEFAYQLHDALEGGSPHIPAWLDKRDLQAGEDWDTQIARAIRECEGLLFLMTADSVEDTSGCKPEWSMALKYKKHLIPLLVATGVDAPFRLISRQHIDFTNGFDAGMAKLRQHLAWRKTPAGELQRMIEHRDDLRRELRRAREEDAGRIRAELEQLEQDIKRQEEIVKDPAAAKRRMEASIERGLERERQPEKPVAGKATTKFINNPPGIAPTYFQDRRDETRWVAEALQNEATRLVTVVGRGGTGKTTIVCRLLKALESGRLPDDPGEMKVDGIVYLSANVHKLNLYPRLYADLCKLIPADAAAELEALAKDPKAGADTKMLALLEHFSEGRYVLLLDNFEDVMDAEKRAITDADTDAALRALLNAPHHSLNTIITTRVLPLGLTMLQAGRQKVVKLDEGLEAPHAENLLRGMDADGKLGLRDLPEDDPLLQAARERTRGYPRALEALVGALNADSSTTLPDLLAQLEAQEAKAGANNPLREFIVEAIVGEAYSRLDPNVQRVMQALAIYGRQVTPSAVDYLLQPHAPGLDSAPVLNRLANMHFARAEAGRYYLHPVDRAYALERIPKGEESDRFEAGQPMFTQMALFHRAANYFVETRKPRAEWKKLDDLAPQLAEFELRFEGGDYEAAARVLADIIFDYLLLWGHARLIAQLYERLEGKLNDADLKMRWFILLALAYNDLGQARRAIGLYEQGLQLARERNDKSREGAFLGNLGNAYVALGEARQAIGYYEDALAIRREIGDRRGEGNDLNNLGLAYAALGETRRAIGYYEDALAIAREIGDRRGEGNRLGNLGNRYAELGEARRAIKYYEDALAIRREIGDRHGEGADLTGLGNRYAELGEARRAIGYYEQALAIAREIGDRGGEGTDLGNLGNAYADLGEVRRAIEYYEDALAIAREIGDRRGEATRLVSMAEVHNDCGDYQAAVNFAREALEIGESIGSPAHSSYGNYSLSQAYLYLNNLPAARAAAEAACSYDVPDKNHDTYKLLGIVALRQGDRDAARVAFSTAVSKADEILAHGEPLYNALDAKGLALCGLAALGDAARLPEAIECFKLARAKTMELRGVIGRVLRRFDALALADTGEVLAGVRDVVGGEKPSP